MPAAKSHQRLVVPAEIRPGERRVAATPETVKTLIGKGLDVTVQAGAGVGSLIPDDAYAAAGANVVKGEAAWRGAEIVLHVRPLPPERIKKLAAGTVTVGFATGQGELPGIAALVSAGVSALAMELVPRISRAQSMDALTSQALVAGYRCVLEAAMRNPRFFPMFMTAAGTVPPAKVLVLGTGVAGLQAIATAKRLGGIVHAYDVRSSSADEVRSMGATFIDLGLEAAEGAGGYARELTEERAAAQQAALAPWLAKSDVVITTAAVPGRPAPRLVTKQMVEGMAPGSVIVDLAAESGGNVEGSVPGKEVRIGDALVYGMVDPASTMPVDASRLYAKNVANLLSLGLADGRFALDLTDEVIDGACLVHAGEVRHAPTAAQLQSEGAKR